MIEIMCATNRPGSRSLEICKILEASYNAEGEECQILELDNVGLEKIEAPYSADNKPQELVDAVSRVNNAKGLVIVCPEYNGSYPGIFKYFIDHWQYPLSFEARPVCFIGLGGKFGGLRPVEHLQGVFGYRNAYMFPERVFITDVWTALQNGKVVDETMQGLIEAQVKGFCKFIKGLQSVGLDALSRAQDAK